jgi:hypothetical protein
MSNENDIESSLFTLLVRPSPHCKYEDRKVNMAFENAHMPLFKVVPPTVGSFIYLECRMMIEAIAYKNGKIVLAVVMAF